ncbi:S49 family peptidase, partial [Nonomuraea sp. NPDC055795]
MNPTRLRTAAVAVLLAATGLAISSSPPASASDNGQSMGDVAASGGYFVAMAADVIVAQPG